MHDLAHGLREAGIVGLDPRAGEAPAQIGEQRLLRLPEPDEADAARRRADQQGAERAIGQGGAHHLPFPTAADRTRGHAEELVRALIDAAFRAVAGLRDGVRDPCAVGQRGLQPAGAHRLAHIAAASGR